MQGARNWRGVLKTWSGWFINIGYAMLDRNAWGWAPFHNQQNWNVGSCCCPNCIKLTWWHNDLAYDDLYPLDFAAILRNNGVWFTSLSSTKQKWNYHYFFEKALDNRGILGFSAPVCDPDSFTWPCLGCCFWGSLNARCVSETLNHPKTSRISYMPYLIPCAVCSFFCPQPLGHRSCVVSRGKFAREQTFSRRS